MDVGRLSVMLGIFVTYCLVTASYTFGLGSQRVYEMVTPLFKGGYGAVLTAASPNGERAVFSSTGGFDGIPLATTGNFYVALRSRTGWLSAPLQPPFQGTIVDIAAPLTEAIANNASEYLLHPLDAPDTLEWWRSFPGTRREGGTGPQAAARYMGASEDLCHFVWEAPTLLPEAPSAPDQIYDISRGCSGEAASVNLIAVRNSDGPHGEPKVLNPACEPFLGMPSTSGDGEQRTSVNAVGDHVVFFTTSLEEGVKAECAGERQVFARVDNTVTLEVSRPLRGEAPFGGCSEESKAGEVAGEVPCTGAAVRPSAYFRGAAADGSRVFFTTHAALTPNDVDKGNDLYMATIGCPQAHEGCLGSERRVTSLERVSNDVSSGEAAEVFGVVGVAQSGDGAYFMAHGVLTSEANSEGEQARVGADNLYGFDSQSGSVRFIAELCSDAELSGSVEDALCPSSLDSEMNDTQIWSEEGEAQTTEDGQYMVFSSYGRLARRLPQADTDSAKDIYRFDLATGALDRVSTGESGFDANGNDNGFDARITAAGIAGGEHAFTERHLASNAISSDGAWVVFHTDEQLSPVASNGLTNVYAWHKEPGWPEGTVEMISSGSSLTNDNGAVIADDTSPQGRDVFFMTSQGLVAPDIENDIDVYDARIDGGQPPAAVGKAQCSDNACQGALANPAPLLTPGSAATAPGGNWPPPKKPKKKRGRAAHRARPRHARHRRSKRGVGAQWPGGVRR